MSIGTTVASEASQVPERLTNLFLEITQHSHGQHVIYFYLREALRPGRSIGIAVASEASRVPVRSARLQATTGPCAGTLCRSATHHRAAMPRSIQTSSSKG